MKLGIGWILMVLGMAAMGWTLIGAVLMELYNIAGWEAAAAVGVASIMVFALWIEEELMRC